MQQMRMQPDGSIVQETPEMLTSDEELADRKKKLEEASEQVLELMSQDGESGWVTLYLVVEEVEEGELYKPEYRSLTAWGTALAEQGRFRLRELWRRRRAGKIMREYQQRCENAGKAAVQLEQIGTAVPTAVNPRNLETVDKIAGGDTTVADRLITQLAGGKIGKRDLDDLWKTAKAAGAEQHKTRQDKAKAEAADSAKDPDNLTAVRIVAAIQAASDGAWLPEERKHRPWIPEKYRVYPELPVYTGATDTPAHIDATVIETYGSEYMTDATVHAIEIKVSESDLLRDVKMGEYADFADYMWLAVPERMQAAAEAHIDELQGSQVWGLMVVEPGADGEDLLRVARKPKRLPGMMRGKVFEAVFVRHG